MKDESVLCIDCNTAPAIIPVWIRKQKKTYIIYRCNCSKQTGYCDNEESAKAQWERMNTRHESKPLPAQSKALTKETLRNMLRNLTGSHGGPLDLALVDDMTIAVEAIHAALPSETAKDQQHTKCAVCLEDKNTPLRRDEMDGYVCLTCIDKQLDKNMETIASQQRQIDDWQGALEAIQLYSDLGGKTAFDALSKYPMPRQKRKCTLRECLNMFW